MSKQPSRRNMKKNKSCECRWAPVNIPFERRLQTGVVLITILIFPVMILSNILFFATLLPLYLVYLGWFLLLDRNAHANGDRTPLVRSWRMWRLFRDYFPSDLVCEEPLNPKQTYVFGVYPHGVIGMAVWANFMNNISGALAKIDYRLVTLKSNFFIPIAREWLLWLGCIGSSKEGILNALNQKKSVMIVVGGAAEALEIHDDYHGIVLERRKGFVEIAIKTGAHLVPVFNFGENELYAVPISNEKGTKVRSYQEKMKDLFGFTLPLVHGRGIWNYSFGMLPFRTPLTTVIGKPIPVEKCANPTPEMKEKYHTLYKNALLDLHARWREKVGETAVLKIIG